MKKIQNHRTRRGRKSKRPMLTINSKFAIQQSSSGPGTLALLTSDIVKASRTDEKVNRAFKEVAPDEFMRFPGEKAPFLDIHQYRLFRKYGTSYIRLKFQDEDVTMPGELSWMLDCADLLFNYYDRLQPAQNELDIIKYATYMTIWSYLSASGFVRVHDTLFNSVPPIYVPPRWPEEEGVVFGAQDFRNGTCIADAVKRKIIMRIVLEPDSFKADSIEVAEFAGMVATMKACKEKGITSGIYTRNGFAVSSVNDDPQGLYFQDKSLSEKDRLLVDQAVGWLKANPEHNQCKKWDDGWGEIQYYELGEDYYAD